MPVLTEALTTDPICDIGMKLWREDKLPVEWRISEGLVPYPEALAAMKARAAAVATMQGWTPPCSSTRPARPARSSASSTT